MRLHTLDFGSQAHRTHSNLIRRVVIADKGKFKSSSIRLSLSTYVHGTRTRIYVYAYAHTYTRAHMHTRIRYGGEGRSIIQLSKDFDA